jgi:hypothetical protein
MYQMELHKVSPLNLPRTQNGEHVKFEEDVQNVFTEAFASSVNLAAQREEMKRLHDAIIEAYLLNQQYDQTASIKHLDRERDGQFRTFKAAVDFYQLGGNAAQQAAAQAVAYMLKPYRDANKKSYANNTSQLRDFTRDVQVAPYAAHLETLGQTEAIAALQATNEAFDTLYNERTAALDDRIHMNKIRELRPQWDKVYRLVTTILPSLHFIETDAAKKQAIAAVLKSINGFAEQLRLTLAHRGGHSSGGSGTGDEGAGVPLERTDNPIIININE